MTNVLDKKMKTFFSSDAILFSASHRPVYVEATEVTRCLRSRTTPTVLKYFEGPLLYPVPQTEAPHTAIACLHWSVEPTTDWESE